MPPAPGSESDRFDTFQNFEIRCEQRDELKVFLADNGIGTLIQWGGKAIHQIRGLEFDCNDLDFTEKLFKNKTISEEEYNRYRVAIKFSINNSLITEQVDVFLNRER